MKEKNDIAKVTIEDEKLNIIIAKDYLRARVERTSFDVAIAVIMLIGLLVTLHGNLTILESIVLIYILTIIIILNTTLLFIWVRNFSDYRNGITYEFNKIENTLRQNTKVLAPLNSIQAINLQYRKQDSHAIVQKYESLKSPVYTFPEIALILTSKKPIVLFDLSVLYPLNLYNIVSYHALGRAVTANAVEILTSVANYMNIEIRGYDLQR